MDKEKGRGLSAKGIVPRDRKPRPLYADKVKEENFVKIFVIKRSIVDQSTSVRAVKGMFRG